ncbi:hypothetical protein Pmani_011736 [Petrolisthes manimaculis]|uniref:Uncharacterized protein n=1 Tax=Petrolisthes manimaculis TaxID=1843537 RepID=A0AAE1PZG7_9EUCA|nr:hypothetical protein Pmani_011736 [Petrolisthes manimaculis]
MHIQWQRKYPKVTQYRGSELLERWLSLPACWLGHVRRMKSGRIPKDLLYGDWAWLMDHDRLPAIGRPRPSYKDVCKKDIKLCNIDVRTWEDYAGQQKTDRTGA